MDIENGIAQLGDLQEQLRQANLKIANLSGLVEISKIINSTLDLDVLLTVIMEIIKQVLNAESSSLMLIDEENHELVFHVALGKKGKHLKEKFRLKMGQGIAGWVAKHGKPLLVPDVRKDKRFFSKPDEVLRHRTRSVLCVPLQALGRTIGVLEAINSRSAGGFSEDDMDLFLAFSSQAAVALESARMHKRLIERQRVKQELTIAHQIQRDFLPESFPDVNSVKFYAHTLPAWETGGDFYDFVDMGDGHIGAVIGDVSGKGVPAALYMVRILSEFRFHAANTLQTDKVLGALNESLLQHSTSSMFVTLLYVIVDTVGHTLSYSSAGHLPILWKKAKSTRIDMLHDAKGVPLGIAQGVPYQMKTVKLQRRDLIFLFTDGLIEARDVKKHHMGISRLKQLLLKEGSGAKATVKRAMRWIERFSRGVPQHDDITAMAIHIR
jgi:sigma-B regulation protein RsbU (phosphoserine phosphatase)